MNSTEETTAVIRMVDILAREVTVFKGKHNSTPQYTDLGTILNGIRDGAGSNLIEGTTRAQGLFQQYFELIDGDDQPALKEAKGRYDELKGVFPMAYFAGRFNGRHNTHVERFSSIVVIDIDGKEQKDRLSFGGRRDDLKRLIFDHPSVVATFISPSGYGLKVLVLVEAPEDQEQQDLIAYYRRAYEAIRVEWESRYEVVIDRVCNNIGRGHYLAHDPDVLVKESTIIPYSVSNAIVPEPPEQREVKHMPLADSEVIPHNEKSRSTSSSRRTITPDKSIVERILEECASRNISLTATYREWVTVGLALKRTFDNDEGLILFDRFSRLDASYDEQGVRDKWSRLHREYEGQVITLASLIWLSKEKGITVFDKLSIADRFECWFLNRYEVKLNMLDHAVYWRPVDENQQFRRYSWDFNISSIGRDAEKDLQASVSDKVVNRVVRDIAFKHQFDPIKEYLDSLVWDGQDRLDDLFRSITTDNDTLFREQFTKWLVNIVPTALGLDANDKVIVLQGEQGTGKTFFLENLLPQYRDFKLTETTIKFNPEDKDDLHKAITRMLIVLDEMTSYSRSNLQAMKSFISSREFTLRAPYGKDYVVCRKTASCCGCVNEDKFLRDVTGDRRYLVFRCLSRDITLFDSIDKEQLLAQVVRMYRDGFDYRLSMEEYQDIIKRNRTNFTAKTTDEIMLEENLYASDIERMTQTEIMGEFRERYGYRFMAQPSTLGLYLKNMGIVSKRMKVGKKLVTYYFCTMNPSTSNSLTARLQAELPDTLF